MNKVTHDSPISFKWNENTQGSIVVRSQFGKVKKGRVYIRLENETIAEQFSARNCRPVAYYRSLAIGALFVLGFPDYSEVKWSTKAGCSMCPCSPGFVVDIPELYGKDVTVTI